MFGPVFSKNFFHPVHFFSPSQSLDTTFNQIVAVAQLIYTPELDKHLIVTSSHAGMCASSFRSVMLKH